MAYCIAMAILGVTGIYSPSVKLDIDAGPASPYVQFVPIRDYELQVICHAKQHFPFVPAEAGT
jgi:hypothetical protein